MDLLLLTYEYPYGKGETYLETEITYASAYFDKVYVLSLSHDTEQTRSVPDNVVPIKVTRNYQFLRCFMYGLLKLFTKETIREFRCLKKLDYPPKLKQAIKKWIMCRMTSKRIDLALKERNLKGKLVGYSYWLDEEAYYLACHKNKFQYTISRAHAYEMRDNEGYIPFRQAVDCGVDEIAFISGYAQDQYNRILAPFKIEKERAKQCVSRLGVINENAPAPTSDHVFRIASCSAIYELKRLDLIVDALQLIPADTQIEWIHFGWGVDGEKIKHQCETKLQEKTNITWELKGWVDNSVVIQFYQNNAISLFMNVSNVEGVPVSIMEAESFGIPCMARAVGGNPEIVIEGKSGYLLSANPTPQEIAERILYLYNNREQMLSRDTVLQTYHQFYDASTNYKMFYEHIKGASEGSSD